MRLTAGDDWQDLGISPFDKHGCSLGEDTPWYCIIYDD